METLRKLQERLKKININVEYVGNYPWIYLSKINGKHVTEKHLAEHGWTIAFLCMDGSYKISNTKDIFKLVRKYK